MMRLLITHAWIRGNLGDFCITRRLLLYLRQVFPQAQIDCMSIETAGWAGAREIAGLVDRFIEQPYAADNTRIFRDYDAVLNAPGGGLQTAGDKRGDYMLRDAAACRTLEAPHVFASHSFHPSFPMNDVRNSLIVAREPESCAFLRSQGCDPMLAADLAFLEPIPEIGESSRRARNGTLLFLRFDHFRTVERHGSVLWLDERTVNLPDAPLALASSDPARDARLMTRLARSWGVPYEPSPDLPHLLDIIGKSEFVVSDRFHPVIFATLLGVPCRFVPRQGSLRDAGLMRQLREHPTERLKHLAQAGLNAIGAILQHAG